MYMYVCKYRLGDHWCRYIQHCITFPLYFTDQKITYYVPHCVVMGRNVKFTGSMDHLFKMFYKLRCDNLTSLAH